MASKQSNTKKRQQPLILSFIMSIGYVELSILRIVYLFFISLYNFIVRWIVRILCVVFGASIAYLTFYFFVVLPQPMILSQYQRISSIVIFDSKGTLLYKEWNTQRQKNVPQDIAHLQDVLPSKKNMASYLSSRSSLLKNTKDFYWFQKKMEFLYPYNSIATAYINAKIYQNGVVGLTDAAEVYFQKSWKTLDKSTLKKLLSIENAIPQKNLYARMPVETSAIRSYIEKNWSKKKIGWIRVETTLDVRIGTMIAMQSLMNPNTETIISEGKNVQAWTKKNDILLAERAITKTTEGGEYNE